MTLANDAVEDQLPQHQRPVGQRAGSRSATVSSNWALLRGDDHRCARRSSPSFFFYRSRMGISMRAVARDQEAAMAQGINIGQVFAIAWGAGAVLAALGGLFATQPPVKQTGRGRSGDVAHRIPRTPGGDPRRSRLGPGRARSAGSWSAAPRSTRASTCRATRDVLGSGYPLIVPYVVMIIVLLVRPYGLFGTPEIRRV